MFSKELRVVTYFIEVTLCSMSEPYIYYEILMKIPLDSTPLYMCLGLQLVEAVN